MAAHPSDKRKGNGSNPFVPRPLLRAAADADRSHKAIVEIRLLGPHPATRKGEYCVNSSFRTGGLRAPFLFGGHFDSLSLRLLRQNHNYESSLAKDGVWRRVLLVAMYAVVCGEKGKD